MSNRAGYRALWAWFGMGRPSWLTLPRVLMHEMPDDWQARMEQLMREYEAEFPNQPKLGTRVSITSLSGKLVKTPEWLLNYRHPDPVAINELRAK